jgi:hypothetical protein
MILRAKVSFELGFNMTCFTELQNWKMARENGVGVVVCGRREYRQGETS